GDHEKTVDPMGQKSKPIAELRPAGDPEQDDQQPKDDIGRAYENVDSHHQANQRGRRYRSLAFIKAMGERNEQRDEEERVSVAEHRVECPVMEKIRAKHDAEQGERGDRTGEISPQWPDQDPQTEDHVDDAAETGGNLLDSRVAIRRLTCRHRYEMADEKERQ